MKAGWLFGTLLLVVFVTEFVLVRSDFHVTPALDGMAYSKSPAIATSSAAGITILARPFTALFVLDHHRFAIQPKAAKWRNPFCCADGKPFSPSGSCLP